jgi:hypothetical protein
MNKKIIIMVLMFSLVSVMVLGGTDKFYKVELMYDHGNISYESLSVLVSNENLAESFGLYNAEVIGLNGELLGLVNFDIPLEVFYDQTDPDTGQIIGGGTIELNETEITLYVPYYENAKEIIIYDQKTELKLAIHVDKFSKEVSGIVDEKEEIIEEVQKEKQIEEQENKLGDENLESESEEETKTIPIWKWILGFVGLLLIIFIVGIIVAVIRKSK